MPDAELARSWEITRFHLDRAIRLVSKPVTSETTRKHLGQCCEYLDHNELELALENLCLAGETIEVPTDFWNELLLAAKNMKLDKWIEKLAQRIGS